MDRRAWWATVHGSTKNRTRLKWLSMNMHIQNTSLSKCLTQSYMLFSLLTIELEHISIIYLTNPLLMMQQFEAVASFSPQQTMQHWFQIIGSKSRNISNVKEILPSQKFAWIFIPTNLGVCFPTTQLSASMKGSSLVCLRFTAGSFSVFFLDLHHFCYSLSTCGPSGNKFLMIISGPKSQLSDGSFQW